MRVIFTGFVAVTATAILAACTAEQPAEQPSSAPTGAPPGAAAIEPVATVRQIMEGITAPTSDVIFNVGVEPPADDAGWQRVETHALALAESANLLMIGGRTFGPKNPGKTAAEGDWVMEAQALVGAGMRAAEAARARDLDALTKVSDEVYATCESCHRKYYAESSVAQGQ